MTYRNYATTAILLALLSMGIYWFVTRPTPEETALKNFFREFRASKYIEAENFTSGTDFYQMAAKTEIIDTDGSKYLVENYFPPASKEVLRSCIELYVRRHVTQWKYLNIDTQEIADNEAVVPFRIAISIKDYTSGNLLGEGHSGRVEGKAYMVNENGEWKVKKFELHLFSDDGMVLNKYIRQAV